MQSGQDPEEAKDETTAGKHKKDQALHPEARAEGNTQVPGQNRAATPTGQKN